MAVSTWAGIYLEVAHELALVGRVVIDLSDLAHLPFVVSVLVRAEDAAQRLDRRK